MATSMDVAKLTAQSEPYTARASVKDGMVDGSTSTITGDRSSSLFTDAESEMGKDDFLMLLVTQLRYQDPLNPMENTEFVSQLAQFRSLENSTNIETAIGELNGSFQSTVDAQKYSAQSITNTGAVSLIGKQVRLRQTTVDWYAKAGAVETLRVHLGNAIEATVEITDEDGNVVRTLKASGKDSQNSVNLEWDGVTDEGQNASSGNYNIHIVGEEQNSSLYAFAEDVVSGVRFTEEGAMLKASGKEFSISKVLDVSMEGSGSSVLSSLSPSTAVSLLGKQVRVLQNALSYGQRDGETISVKINAGVNEKVRVDLKDTSGKVVYSTTFTRMAMAKESWYGMDRLFRVIMLMQDCIKSALRVSRLIQMSMVFRMVLLME